MAPGLSAVTVFHQDVGSQSTIRSEADRLDRARLARLAAFSSLVYASHAMDDLIARIECARKSSAPMLITGETGTGKELLARAVHAISDRCEREFIPFNCATATRELIESRLFGHQRGSFTGADRNLKGVIREAEGGTLLLDEIGELIPDAQPMLLRFLQEGEVHPLGSPKPVKTDVRVIAATNRDLEADVQSGRFRADLYERLNVLRFHIPPLRERREDIRPLVEHFLDLHQRQEGKQGLRLSDEAWAVMFGYDWPGNVRELAGMMLRLVIFAANGEVVGRKRALDAIRAGICALPPAAVVIEGRGMIDLNLPLHEAADELKRLLIEHALKATGGNRIRAAARLKINRDGLRKMINRLKIKVDRDDRRK
ncbi:MAG: sigma-54 interaction domain-containing protein [Blastocatellia bacterium]